MEYLHSENLGRKALTTLLRGEISDLCWAPIASRYDGSFTWRGLPCIFELKYRKHSINRYPSHLLERSKWDELCRHHKAGKTALYINIFLEADGSLSGVIYNLSARISRFGDDPDMFFPALQPVATDEAKGRIIKEVAYLTPSTEDHIIHTSNPNENYYSGSGNGLLRSRSHISRAQVLC